MKSNVLIFIYLSIFIPIYLSLPDKPSIFNTEKWIDISDELSNNFNNSINYFIEEDTIIYIGISNFRDRRCGVTLKNIFTKAKYPNNIHIGINEQIHTEDDHIHCVKDFCQLTANHASINCKFTDQIHYIIHSYLDSRGPGIGRYIEKTLMNDENFCMQIDSHVDVVQDWDSKLLSMWERTNNEFAVLSTRLPDVSSLTKTQPIELPHLCLASFTASGSVRSLQPRSIYLADKPVLAPLWSAGFSFAKCHMDKKVPYDPNFPFIFDGEEFARYIRLWTHGYDVYSPNELVLAHDYGDKLSSELPESLRQDPMNSNNNNIQYKIDPFAWIKKGLSADLSRLAYDEALNRLLLLIKGEGIKSSSDPAATLSILTGYGLGNKRTLDQFIEFTGIDVRNGVIFGDRCKGLRLVPFKPDPDPYVSYGDVWGFGPEVLKSSRSDIPLINSVDITIVLPNQDSSTSSPEILATSLPNLRRNQITQKSSGFGVLDRYIYLSISAIDEKLGLGHGLKAVKVFLLVFPVIVAVIMLAVWILVGDSRSTAALSKSS